VTLIADDALRGVKNITLRRIDAGTPTFRISLTSPTTARAADLCGFDIRHRHPSDAGGHEPGRGQDDEPHQQRRQIEPGHRQRPVHRPGAGSRLLRNRFLFR